MNGNSQDPWRPKYGKVFQSIREDGVALALRRSVETLFFRFVRPWFFRYEAYRDRRFDRRLNINTCEFAHLDELTIDSDNTEFGDDEMIYLPLPVLALKMMRRLLPRRLEHFTFVDFGSGKGRVVLFASQLRFRRVVGVEFARELHAIARRNLDQCAAGRRRCSDVQLLLQDAVTMEIPDDPCVLFLFNPFEEHVLAKVVQNIVASHRAHTRELYVVYFNPLYSAVFEQHDCFERLHTLRAPWLSECYNVDVFRTVAAAA